MKLLEIFKLFEEQGVCDIYIKFLSPNDNSKNQIYLGDDETVQIMPATDTTLTIQTSEKDGAGTYIFQNRIDFSWLTSGGIKHAPNAKLIFYPQYPETRLSGFLKGCTDAPSDLLAGRHESRVLFFGSNGDLKSFGHVTWLDQKLKNQIFDEAIIWKLPKQKTSQPVFFLAKRGEIDPIQSICKVVREIHQSGWVEGCKLDKDGIRQPYNARNAGGYTLEAYLKVKPNGRPEPDYEGWEVKQHSVDQRIVTLMTPDPDLGYCSDFGIRAFIEKFGYPDKAGKVGRINFGGVYRNGGEIHKDTKLKLTVTGFKDSKIVEATGAIHLADQNGNPIISWSFEKLMKHWTRKHAKTVFVPSEEEVRDGKRFYKFSNEISLGQYSHFINFISLINDGKIYLDPALKATSEEAKARFQFRMNKEHLKLLYTIFQEVSL